MFVRRELYTDISFSSIFVISTLFLMVLTEVSRDMILDECGEIFSPYSRLRLFGNRHLFSEDSFALVPVDSLDCIRDCRAYMFYNNN